MSRRSTRIAEQAMRNAFEHVLEAQRLTEARISAMSEQIAALWGEDNDDESEPDAQPNEANKEPARPDNTRAVDIELPTRWKEENPIAILRLKPCYDATLPPVELVWNEGHK